MSSGGRQGMFEIILLVVVVFLLGYLLFRILKITPENNEIDNLFVYIGAGIGIFILLSVIFTLAHIPVHWSAYLILISVISSLTFKTKFNFKLNFTKFKSDKGTIYSIIVLALFMIMASVMYYGANQYPWLEDGDPWHHATVTKYIATEKTLFEPAGAPDLLKYLDPYPGSYNAIMAFAYQLKSNNIIFTLKMLNALLVALTIPLAWLVFKRMFKELDKALLATVILFLIPCFLSHFIWAITICMVMFFVALYGYTRIGENKANDREWCFITAFMTAALLITQPSTCVILLLMIGIYILVKMFVTRSWQKFMVIAFIVGILFSFIWWGPAFIRWGSPLDSPGWNGVYNKGEAAYSAKALDDNPGIWRIKGTGDRVYTFTDFLLAKGENVINNPIGLGPIIFLCLLSGVLFLFIDYKKLKGDEWRLTSLIWLGITFLGIIGASLPIEFISFRFWMLFAVPVVMIIGGGLVEFYEKYTKISKYAMIGLLIILVILTSGIPKYQVNTAQWGPGIFTSSGELTDYLDMGLPKGTRIYPLCMGGTDKLIAFGYDTCAWCKDEYQFRTGAINKTAEEIHTFLKYKEYAYAIIDGQCVAAAGQDITNAKINEMLNSTMFALAKQPLGTVLFKVN